MCCRRENGGQNDVVGSATTTTGVKRFELAKAELVLPSDPGWLLGKRSSLLLIAWTVLELGHLGRGSVPDAGPFRHRHAPGKAVSGELLFAAAVLIHCSTKKACRLPLHKRAVHDHTPKPVRQRWAAAFELRTVTPRPLCSFDSSFEGRSTHARESAGISLTGLSSHALSNPSFESQCGGTPGDSGATLLIMQADVNNTPVVAAERTQSHPGCAWTPAVRAARRGQQAASAPPPHVRSCSGPQSDNARSSTCTSNQ